MESGLELFVAGLGCILKQVNKVFLESLWRLNAMKQQRLYVLQGCCDFPLPLTTCSCGCLLPVSCVTRLVHLLPPQRRQGSLALDLPGPDCGTLSCGRLTGRRRRKQQYLLQESSRSHHSSSSKHHQHRNSSSSTRNQQQQQQQPPSRLLQPLRCERAGVVACRRVLISHYRNALGADEHATAVGNVRKRPGSPTRQIARSGL